MNTLELIQKLEPLICPAYDMKYSKPIWGNSKVCLTNGHMAILFRHDKLREEWKHDERLIRQAEPMIKPGSATLFNPPNLEPDQCWLTPNKPTTTRCSECEGTGVVICNYGHEHDCEECGGEGISEDFLITKWLNTPSDDRNCKTDLGKFDKRYLWMVSEIAKHRTIIYSTRPAGEGVILCFEFEDGHGGLLSVVDRGRYRNVA